MPKNSNNKEKNCSSMVCVAIITAVHGIYGDIKLRSFTANPSDISKFKILYDESGSNQVPLQIRVASNNKIIAKIQGVTTRNEAEKRIGQKLFIFKEDMPQLEEEEYYHQDLVGLKVLFEKGNQFGIIKAVHNYGAGDVIEILPTEAEKTEFYSFTSQVFPQINVKEGYIVICPPEIV
jgi:16S rRNA processing protein RimM